MQIVLITDPVNILPKVISIYIYASGFLGFSIRGYHGLLSHPILGRAS